MNQEIVASNIDEYIRFVKIDVRTSLGADFKMWEYHLAVYNMNERKQTTGEDEIPIEVCKLIPSEKLKDAILTMINNNPKNGSTPQGTKSALIAYLHKKGDTNITDNYRTLSLLSHLGKIQERMILRRLDEFAEETNAYGKTQQGFRHGRGCADAALMMNRLDHLALENGVEIFKIFVDNTKAYDMVNSEVSWMVNREKGITDESY